MIHNIIELSLVKVRVVPWPASPGLILIRRVADRKRFTDMFGNAEENMRCEVWPAQELAGFELLVEKSTTCGYAPMLQAETDFDRLGSETMERPCVAGFLQLGQVAAIKDRDKWKPHHPKHACIVIDTSDVQEAVVYDLAEKMVVSVPHARLVVPEFLMPCSGQHAVQVKIGIIRQIKEAMEAANAAAVVAMEAPNAFPAAEAAAVPMEEGEQHGGDVDEQALLIVEEGEGEGAKSSMTRKKTSCYRSSTRMRSTYSFHISSFFLFESFFFSWFYFNFYFVICCWQASCFVLMMALCRNVDIK